VAMATTRGIREVTFNENSNDAVDDNKTEHDTDTRVDSPKRRLRLVESQPKSDPNLGLSIMHMSNIAGKRNPSSNSLYNMSNREIISAGVPISKQTDHEAVVQHLESHPINPYYLSGGVDGTIVLWGFNAPKETAAMATYRGTPGPRISRIHFNPSGTKFGACDVDGYLALWRFDSNESSLKPFQSLRCHDKRTLDFAFVNSGSLIASAGISTNKQNVCLWDTLLPPSKSLVRVFNGQDSGTSSICYSARHQLLITGGKKGDIVIYDIRQQKILDTIKGHTMNVKSLALSPPEDFILTGSNEGNIKMWDLPSFSCKESWDDIHAKQTFVRKPGVFAAAVSTYGVMQVLMGDRSFYTCGSDGRIMKIPFEASMTAKRRPSCIDAILRPCSTLPCASLAIMPRQKTYCRNRF